ncbi:hypothetical protein P9112_001047 [Eukaryota sp. TZLM1-RC]
MWIFFLLCLTLLVSADSSLHGVIVTTRHGDRSPLRTYPQQFATWNCTMNLFSSLHFGENSVRYPYFRKNYVADKQALSGSCFLGQLTNKGGLQHFDLGRRLREQYNSILPSIPDETTYFRSTDLPRTQESLISNILGTFPSLQSSSHVPDINIFERPQETLLANAGACPRLKARLDDLYSSNEWVSKEQSLEHVRRKLEIALGVEVVTLDDWNKGFDYLYTLVNNALPLPRPITYQDYQELFELKSWQLYRMYSEEFLTLSLGVWFKELKDSIREVFEGKSIVKYRVFSGHDTTVMPLLQVLDIANPEWPPYAANVALELWSVDGKPTIRAVYNGEPIKMRYCSSVNCPLQMFEERIGQFSVSRQEWETLCM